MPDIPVNPFIYGRPVIRKEFFGRESEIRTVLSRLRNRESTAIVAEPRIGKTSFLLHLLDKEILSNNLEETFVQKIIPCFIDLCDKSSSYTPKDFWDEVFLSMLQEKDTKKLVGKLVIDAQEKRYDSKSIEKVFTTLSSEGYLFLLLLDEFDVLFENKAFLNPTFFTSLRRLISLSGGLAIVIASRLTIAEMNKRGGEVLATGSPFFNTLIQIRLKPFDDKTIEKLLSQTALTEIAQKQIRRMAGRHPFVLQAMAAAYLQDANTIRASEECYKQIKSHFDDIWTRLPDQVRIPAVILCLNEYKNKIEENSFHVETALKNRDKFHGVLSQLEELGMVEKITKTAFWEIDWGTFFSDRQGTWAVSSWLFIWWVYDVLLDESHRESTSSKFSDWLTADATTNLIPQNIGNKLFISHHLISLLEMR